MRQALFYAFDGYLFIHFVLTATLWERYYFYPYFTEEELRYRILSDSPKVTLVKRLLTTMG